MAAIKAKAAGGKWSVAATWEPEQVPTAADDVTLAEASGNVEISAEAKCRSLDASLYKKTLTFVAGLHLNIGTATSNAGLCLKLGAGMTVTIGASSVIGFVGTSAEVQKITTAGKKLPEVSFKGAGGKWQLGDKLEVTTAIGLIEGTLETNGQEVVTPSFVCAIGTTIKLGASVITLTGTGTVWEAGSTTVVEAGTSTIEVTDATEEVKRFIGGGKTYNNVIIASDNVEITGSNTISALEINTAGKSVKGTLFKEGTTQTVTVFRSNSTFNEPIKLKSSVAAKRWKLKKAAGMAQVEGVELQDAVGEGGATFRDVFGVSVSGNEGWTFTAVVPEVIANSTTPGATTRLGTLTVECKLAQEALTNSIAAPTPLQGSVCFRVVVDSEIMLVFSGQGGTAWKVLRAVEGSTEEAHSVGTPVYHLPTIEGLKNVTNLGRLTAAIAYRKAVQEMPASTFARVKATTVIKDPGGNINTGEGYYTTPAEGYYQVSGNVAFAGTGVLAGDTLIASIEVGVTEKVRGLRIEAAAGNVITATVAGIVFCLAGEQIALLGRTTSKGETEESTGERNVLCVVRVA